MTSLRDSIFHRIRLAWAGTLLVVAAASALVPGDSIMPGEVFTINGGNTIYIPKGVQRVRGIMLSDAMTLGLSDIDHDASVMCHIWDFARICMDRNMVTAEQKSDFQRFFADAASASGHPEVANVPIVYSCGRWLEKDFLPQVKDKILAATLFDGAGDATVLSKNTLAFYYVYECRHADMIPAMPGAASAARSQGYPLGYYPVWGWTRGHFNGKSYAWAAYDWATKNLIPEGQVPADGKMDLATVDLQKGWLGDPSTWTGDYPKAYRYNEFSGDKSKAPWMPDEYTARVWRATVAKHPTLQNRENPSWGIMRQGTHGDNTWECSSPPQVGVIQPISIYNKVTYNPIMVPRDTILRVRIGCDYTDLKELRVYEGHKHITTLKPTAYGVYFASCTLSTPGIRAIIVEAELDNGKVITSWPATVFVDTEAATVAAEGQVALPGSLAARLVSVGPEGDLRVTIAGTLGSGVVVELRDARGRVVAAALPCSVAGTSLCVDLGPRAPGAYVLVVHARDREATERFVVPAGVGR